MVRNRGIRLIESYFCRYKKKEFVSDGVVRKGLREMANDIIAGMGTSAGQMGTVSVRTRKGTASDKKRAAQKKNLRKKQLNYNTREISSQILQAVKSEIASIVLIRAKMKVGVLKRCLGTGQYNDREVTAAITHAQRMVNCAKLKVKNLKEEEEQGHDNEKERANHKLQKKSEIKRRVSQKEQELKNKIAIEKMQQVRKEKMQRQELMRRKKMHRSQELAKIQEADMKYLKDKTESENSSSEINYSGVSLELSAAAMGLQELRLSEHALKLEEQQLEQEIKMQVEMQMQAEGGSFEGYSGMDTGAGQDVAADGGVAAVSIDISI